jgi:hypothetical protein
MNMKTCRSTLLWAFGFLAVGVALSVLAMLVVISQSGEARASALCNGLVFSAYWPSLLVGVNRDRFFSSLWLIVLNGVGWSLIGLLIAALRPTRKSPTMTPPE